MLMLAVKKLPDILSELELLDGYVTVVKNKQ